MLSHLYPPSPSFIKKLKTAFYLLLLLPISLSIILFGTKSEQKLTLKKLEDYIIEAKGISYDKKGKKFILESNSAQLLIRLDQPLLSAFYTSLKISQNPSYIRLSIDFRQKNFSSVFTREQNLYSYNENNILIKNLDFVASYLILSFYNTVPGAIVEITQPLTFIVKPFSLPDFLKLIDLFDIFLSILLTIFLYLLYESLFEEQDFYKYLFSQYLSVLLFAMLRFSIGSKYVYISSLFFILLFVSLPYILQEYLNILRTRSLSGYLRLTSLDISILKEILSQYIVVFSIITTVLVLNNIAYTAQLFFKAGIPLGNLPKITVYLIPFAGVLAIPYSTLIAVGLTYNRLTTSNEVLSVLTSGVRRVRLIYPALVFGVLVYIFGRIFFETLMVWGTMNYYKTWWELNLEKPPILLNPGEFTDIQYNIRISFQEMKNYDLLNEIYVIQKGENVERIINAKKGILKYSQENNFYTLKLADGMIIEKKPQLQIENTNTNTNTNQTQQTFDENLFFSGKFSTLEINLPISTSSKVLPLLNASVQSSYKIRKRLSYYFEKKQKVTKNTVKMYMYYILSVFYNLIKPVSPYEYETFFAELKRFKTLYENDVNDLKYLSNSRGLKYDLMEYYKKVSIPFSSILFSLLGFGLGVLFRGRSGRSEAVVISVVVMLLHIGSYYYLLDWVLRDIISPFLGAWIANIFVAIISIPFVLKEL